MTKVREKAFREAAQFPEAGQNALAESRSTVQPSFPYSPLR
jgi:hypothetical protein